MSSFYISIGFFILGFFLGILKSWNSHRDKTRELKEQLAQAKIKTEITRYELATDQLLKKRVAGDN
jgi:hypothetical protein